MNTSMETNATVMFAAGGTGGHIFPAVAVAEYLQDQDSNIELRFTGTPERMESRIIPDLNFPFDPISFRGWRGLNIHALRFPFELLAAVLKARRLLKRHRVQVAVGTGSYISVPACLAAASMRIPIVLLEANMNTGKANALLARFAHTICISFESTRKLLQTKAQVVHTGNPVRKAMQSMPSQQEAKQHLNLSDSNRVVFAFGGSLGAESINKSLLQGLETLEQHGIRLIWQTGKNNLPKHVDELRQRGHIVQEFFNEMATPLAAADLVVSRSGGTTVAELTAIGQPAVLVPMPHAANNEQLMMAELLAEHNACVLVRDAAVENELIPAIVSCFETPNRIESMSKATLSFGNLKAASEVGNIVRTLLP